MRLPRPQDAPTPTSKPATAISIANASIQRRQSPLCCSLAVQAVAAPERDTQMGSARYQTNSVMGERASVTGGLTTASGAAGAAGHQLWVAELLLWVAVH